MNAWPQYVMLGMLCLNLVAHLIKDQSEKPGTAKACAVFASFLVFGLNFGLLYAGGFWSPFGW